jgi:hypothetical protein
LRFPWFEVSAIDFDSIVKAVNNCDERQTAQVTISTLWRTLPTAVHAGLGFDVHQIPFVLMFARFYLFLGCDHMLVGFQEFADDGTERFTFLANSFESLIDVIIDDDPLTFRLRASHPSLPMRIGRRTFKIKDLVHMSSWLETHT